MKRFLEKYGHLLALFAVVIAKDTNGFTCPFVFHQPKMPEAVKAFRKF